jgi:hypothetical protein
MTSSLSDEHLNDSDQNADPETNHDALAKCDVFSIFSRHGFLLGMSIESDMMINSRMYSERLNPWAFARLSAIFLIDREIRM